MTDTWDPGAPRWLGRFFASLTQQRGRTPSTLALASLSGDNVPKARALIAERLCDGRDADESVPFIAEAHAVRGRVK
jgi:hypothetical protein